MLWLENFLRLSKNASALQADDKFFKLLLSWQTISRYLHNTMNYNNTGKLAFNIYMYIEMVNFFLHKWSYILKTTI